MVTKVKVSVNTEIIHGIEMVSVIGHVGNGKFPIAKIVMGTFPLGTTTVSEVLNAWTSQHPNTVFEA